MKHLLRLCPLVLTTFLLLCHTRDALAADWPMFGGDPTYNAVSPEKNPPLRWSVRESEKAKKLHPDAVFVPTPQDVVERMLQLSQVTKDDLVVDLGSGDGRILITAAKQHGAQVAVIEVLSFFELLADMERMGRIGRAAGKRLWDRGQCLSTAVRPDTHIMTDLPKETVEWKISDHFPLWVEFRF